MESGRSGTCSLLVGLKKKPENKMKSFVKESNSPKQKLIDIQKTRTTCQRKQYKNCSKRRRF